MKLSLHPNPGNGMTWELTLEVAGVEFGTEVGERKVAARKEQERKDTQVTYSEVEPWE